MRVSSVIGFVVSALVASVAANELKITKTKEVDCSRKTKVCISRTYTDLLSMVTIPLWELRCWYPKLCIGWRHHLSPLPRNPRVERWAVWRLIRPQPTFQLQAWCWQSDQGVGSGFVGHVHWRGEEVDHSIPTCVRWRWNATSYSAKIHFG